MKRTGIFLIMAFIEIQGIITAGALSHDSSTVVLDSMKVSSTNGSQEENNGLHTTWYQMFTEIPKDELLFFKDSFQLSKVPTYLGLTVLTGSLMKVDQSGWKADRKLYTNSNIFKTASDVSVNAGDGKFHFLLSGLFASYGVICNDPVALRTSSNIMESVLATGLLVQVIKHATGRESPAYAINKKWKWQFFPSVKEYQKNQPKYYSFPSGHLAAASATLTVIINNYPQATWLKPAGYSVLGLLGLGLVSKGMHWYSDLPLGFFIGYSMGNIVAPGLKLPEEKTQGTNLSGLSVSPSLYNNKIGLHVAYSF